MTRVLFVNFKSLIILHLTVMRINLQGVSLRFETLLNWICFKTNLHYAEHTY